MARKSNLSATRGTVRSLRRAEVLVDVDAAFIVLAETTARMLDDALAEEERAYALAPLARAHADALRCLVDRAEAARPNDHLDRLLAAAMTPTPGTPEAPPSHFD